MSTTISRNLAVGTIRTFNSKYLELHRAEVPSEAIATAGDDKYLGINGKTISSSPYPDLSLWMVTDATVPSGANTESVTLNIRLAGEQGATAQASSFPETVYSSTITFPAPVGPSGEIKEANWIDGVYTFPLTVSRDQLWNYAFGVSSLGTLGTSKIVYVDYANFDVIFTLSLSIPSDVTVYETTQYSAKVTSGLNTAQCINSTYPLTCWFEWTAVDPTGRTDFGSLPLETTPVQTFTTDPPLTPEGRPGQFRIYDTLPSPLDVQNPRKRLQPNTTYWVRAASSVNGEVQYSSSWTSFTTLSNDKVTL